MLKKKKKNKKLKNKINKKYDSSEDIEIED